MFQKRLQLIIRHGTLSLTMLSTIAASLVGGPALRATARTQPQAIATAPKTISQATPLAATQAGTYGSTAGYTGGVCLGVGNPLLPVLFPNQSPRATNAPDGSFASLLGVGCQLTVNFATAQTGNVKVYAVSSVALDVAPTVDLLDASNNVLQSFTGLAGLALAGSPSTTLIYTGTAAYSKIRFSNLASVGTGGIDAVEALPDAASDPYGNAAQNFGTVCTNLLGANPDAVLGAPDGNVASLALGVGCTLRVDMGKNQSSTGHLRIYSRATVALSGATNVTLRDDNGNIIQTFNSLVDLSVLGCADHDLDLHWHHTLSLRRFQWLARRRRGRH